MKRSIALWACWWIASGIATRSDGAEVLERPIVISAYQGPCRDGDFAANLAVVRANIETARQRKSDFVVFPETFLSGYATPDQVRKGARSIDDPELSAFIGESARHSMVVLVGLARIAPEGLYNSILVIHQGKLMGTYDKVMLTGQDRDQLGFLPGKQIPVFDAQGVRFGVIICADSSFLHVAMSSRLKGARILFSPHYNYIPSAAVDDHRRVVRHCHVGLACHLRMVVVRSNVVVTDRPGQPGYGDSFILDPLGEPIAEARLFKTELITGTVTPAHFRPPYVWGDLDRVPDWLRDELADQIRPSKEPGLPSEASNR